MRHRKVEVYILTLVFLAVALVFGIRDPENWAQVSFTDGRETIRVWNPGNGEGYVFLPGYADLDGLQIRTNRRLRFDDIQLTDGKTCGSLELDKTYSLSGIPNLFTITFLKSENLPAMYIDTASGSMEAVHEAKTNKERAVMRLYSPAGEILCRDNLEFIKGRGNSTFAAEKKPYNLRLSGEKDLLDMGAGQNWILLANARDATNLRNKIVYDLADLPYSPESRFVDLYLNGDYAGLYLLSERNEIHPRRVDIGGEGSFLVSLEAPDRLAEQDLPHITTQSGAALRIHESRVDAQELQELWQRAEDAILSGDPRLEQMIDLDSWARKYLIEEIFGNIDGGRYSQFFYRDGSDGRIAAGPVWDYDLAMSNPTIYWEAGLDSYRDSQYRAFYVNTNPGSWFYALYRNEGFRARVEALFREEYLPLLESLNREGLDDYEEAISRSARMNEIRWNGGSFREETAYLKRCLAGRTEFLKSVWVEHRQYLTVDVYYLDRNFQYALLPGEDLTALPAYEIYQWYLAGTDTPLDAAEPVFADMEIGLEPKGA